MPTTNESKTGTFIARIRGETGARVRWSLAIVSISFLVTLWVYRAASEDVVPQQNSISAYYYVPYMGWVFSLSLSAIGVLLILYRGEEYGEYWLLNLAGLMIIVVAWCPMDDPTGPVGSDGAADRPAMSMYARVHYGAAVLFFLCLGIVGAFLDKISLRSADESDRKLVYTTLYNLTGWGLLSVPLIAYVLSRQGAQSAVFWVECTAAVIFCFFWLVKIAELRGGKNGSTPTHDEEIKEQERKVLKQVLQIDSPKSIQTRLSGSMDAQTRARFVLIVIVITCTALLIASYNAYLSFDRDFALLRAAKNSNDLERSLRKGTQRYPEIATQLRDPLQIPDVLTEQKIKAWSDSRSINSSLLGIRVSVDDAPVLGSAALFVLSIWFMLCARREYYIIYFLLKDTQQFDPKAPDPKRLKLQWNVFQGVTAWSVFTIYFRRFLPVWGGLGDRVGIERQDEDTGLSAVLQSAFLTALVNLVIWLPVITLLAVIVLDRISYYQRSPFRPGLVNPKSDTLSDIESTTLVVSVVFTVLTIVMTTLVAIYRAHTEMSVKKYYTDMQVSLFTLAEVPLKLQSPPPAARLTRDVVARLTRAVVALFGPAGSDRGSSPTPPGATEPGRDGPAPEPDQAG